MLGTTTKNVAYSHTCNLYVIHSSLEFFKLTLTCYDCNLMELSIWAACCLSNWNSLFYWNFSIFFCSCSHWRSTTKYFWSEYEFTGAEVPISVVTFEFTIAGTVVYVIGYCARTNRAEGIDAMQSVISQMVDKS